MMKPLRFAAGILVCCALLLMGEEGSAKEKPIINWSPNVYATGVTDHLLDYGPVRKEIAAAITRKLHNLDRQKKLPFTLREAASGTDVHAIDSGMVSYSLIPFSVMDISFDSSYRLPTGTYYKSVIISALNLAVVAKDPDSDGDRLLGTVPVYGYDVLGDSNDGPMSSPITREQKAALYKDITIQMIDEKLDFSKQKKLLRDLEVRALDPDSTWQVTAVNISSQKAGKVYGSKADRIRQAIGAFFTGSFQQSTGHTVYPSVFANHVYGAVNDNLESFQMNSPLGNKKITYPKAAHPITLDITGIASGVADSGQSDVVNHVVYKGWLKMSMDNGRAESERDDVRTRQHYKTGNVDVAYDDADVYTEIFLDLADKMGQQKKSR